MSIIQHLIRQFFPPKQDPSVAILGVDSAGKTTLLYLLKLGEVVTTIPTLGINYESFTVPTADGTISNKKLDGWDIGLGCGRDMPGMVIMYGKYSHGLIWMVDNSDRERFQESVDDLTKAWLSCEYERHSEGNPLNTTTGAEVRILRTAVMISRLHCPQQLRSEGMSRSYR